MNSVGATAGQAMRYVLKEGKRRDSDGSTETDKRANFYDTVGKGMEIVGRRY